MKPVIVNAGGGTNFVGLMVRAVRLGLRVDHLLFADTGGEMRETYSHLWDFSEWLERHGMPGIEIVTETRHGKPITLEEHALRTKRMPSKAYGRKSCSMKFKRDPIEKWIRAEYPEGQVVRIFGFDADEPQRARMPESERFLWSYPLIDWGMGREECIEEIVWAGLPLPGKSACFFCPSARPAEVADLAVSDPDLFARGMAMEANARPFSGAVKGLGSNYSWESVDRAVRLQVVMPEAPRVHEDCGCYDGARQADTILAPDYCGNFAGSVVRGDGGEWPLARDWAHSNGPAWKQGGMFG
jgi:hypothetical protein